MIRTICVVGAGRVGSAIAARLSERGVAVIVTGRELQVGPADLVVLCIPDSAIAAVAGAIAPGPWIAHTSGATGLAALAPHTRRLSLHPLQTFTRARGADQLDGAFAAITAESPAALTIARELAGLLGLEPFALADADRAAYHAGAAIVSNYLVTLQRAASLLLTGAGAPPAALVPLMRRTIDNGFELTGPISRGDWTTVDRHLEAIRERTPALEPLYRVLADATVALAVDV
jgi:predicted short-subunit dehydrogenase-like oxidoreductase (DUF2520 family)